MIECLLRGKQPFISPVGEVREVETAFRGLIHGWVRLSKFSFSLNKIRSNCNRSNDLA